LGGHTGSEPPPRSTHRLLNFFAIATAAAVLFAALVSRQAFHGEISFDRGIDITKLVGETLGVFLLLLGTEFILSIFAGMVAPIRCRSCQGSMVAVHAVGKSCKYCDEDLTPWIFAPALSELITHPDLLSQSSDESNSSASGTPAIND